MNFKVLLSSAISRISESLRAPPLTGIKLAVGDTVCETQFFVKDEFFLKHKLKKTIAVNHAPKEKNFQ